MRLPFSLALAATLAACGSQQAGYEIGDRNHSLSITRAQAYPNAPWDTYLVVSRFPECQRRYALKPTGDKFKMNVYRYEPGVFVLNAGKRWYAAETKTCGWDTFKEPPSEPGDLVGAFKVKGAALVFVKAEAGDLAGGKESEE